MKIKATKILLCFIALQFCITQNKAQEVVQGLKQVFDITMDDLGNAEVEVSMKLNASQWDAFKRNMGNNTSVLKRGMIDALPKYYLTDFNYSEEQMDRTYKMKFKVLGLCTTNKNGKWEAELESKNPDITKLSDKEFVMTQDMMSDGMLIQQTQKLHLPSGASDAKVEKDSFGKAMLTYSTGPGMVHTAINIGGILLIICGGFLFYKNQTSRKNNLKVAKEPIAA
ncbi:MAG: hypothetical protein ABI683_06535 [Ginsengibacter sp.]